jgi:hypothetical protein
MEFRVKGRFSKFKKFKQVKKLKHNASVTVTACSTDKTDNENSWRHGRRIVELGILADNLKECYHCKNRLSLCDILKETIQGLGSLLTIQCDSCLKLNQIPTGKRHGTKGNNNKKCFDVNTKLAAGMYNYIYLM